MQCKTKQKKTEENLILSRNHVTCISNASHDKADDKHVSRDSLTATIWMFIRSIQHRKAGVPRSKIPLVFVMRTTNGAPFVHQLSFAVKDAERLGIAATVRVTQGQQESRPMTKQDLSRELALHVK